MIPDPVPHDAPSLDYLPFSRKLSSPSFDPRVLPWYLFLLFIIIIHNSLLYRYRIFPILSYSYSEKSIFCLGAMYYFIYTTRGALNFEEFLLIIVTVTLFTFIPRLIEILDRNQLHKIFPTYTFILSLFFRV